MDGNGINTNLEDPKLEGTQNETNEKKEEGGLVQQLLNALTGKKDKSDTGGEADPEGDVKEEKKEKMFTQEEFNKALQAEQEKIKNEQLEQERLAKLNPEDKEKEEKELQLTKIQNLENKILQSELKASAIQEFNKEGFPVGLADIIHYSSKEDTINSITKIKEVFKECMAEALNQKLKGKTPAGLGGADATGDDVIAAQISKNLRGGY